MTRLKFATTWNKSKTILAFGSLAFTALMKGFHMSMATASIFALADAELIEKALEGFSFALFADIKYAAG